MVIKKLVIDAAYLLMMASFGCSSEEAKKETVEKTQEATTTIKEAAIEVKDKAA